MLDAIVNVTTGLTLVAFIAACAALLAKHSVAKKERLIKSAPESERTPLVMAAMEFFHVDASGLTKEQQYNIVIQQINNRRDRFNKILIFSAFCLALLLTASAYAIYLKSREERPTRNTAFDEIVKSQPTSFVSVDRGGSAVQLFQGGWLFVNFSKAKLFAITRSHPIVWYSVDEQYVKGSDNCHQQGLFGGQLRLGFCWMYGLNSFSDMRARLGQPIGKETRAIIQFQEFGHDLLVYGLPATQQGVQTEHFQALGAVYLQDVITKNSGRARFTLIYPSEIEGNPYCSSNWYVANKQMKLHEQLRNRVASGLCEAAVGPRDFFSGARSVRLM